MTTEDKNYKQQFEELSKAVHDYLLAKPSRQPNIRQYLISHGWNEEDVPSEKRWRHPDNKQMYNARRAAHLVREKLRRKMARLAGCLDKLAASKAD